MAVTELPPQIAYPVQEVQSYYALEGDGGHALLAQFQSVVMQWKDRPSLSVEPAAFLDQINHVPFKKVGTVTVRFRKTRPMQARMIDIEEFEAE